MANVGPISLRNVHVLYPNSQEFTNSKGGKAAVAFVVINNSPDKGDHLTGISTDVGNIAITPDGASDLPAGRTLVAGVEQSDPNVPAFPADPEAHPIRVEVNELKQDITPGLTVPLTFDFEKAGQITVEAPVDAGPELARQQSSMSGEGEASGEHGGH